MFNYDEKKGLRYYYYFIGKDKNEILINIKEEFICYPDNIWICKMKNGWWDQKKTFLILKFDEDNTLKYINIEIHIL
ncbi:hypothetical protein HZQ04_18475 [Elizabethkingia anophelis]|nr:hypothetical protein [Elizabethkingia anophelis]